MKRNATVETTQLDSGLRIATDKMQDIETVSVGVWVNTGSKNESIEDNGISHFLEHMAFKGTENRTVRELAETFDELGGKFNAFTSRERTVYYAKVLKEDIEKAVDILADILLNSTFDAEELEKERGVILQEIAMTLDDPDEAIDDFHQEAAFENQAIGRSILGSTKNVESITRDDLNRYIDKQYTTENIVVSFAGNINHNTSVNLVKKHFKNLKEGTRNTHESAIYTGGEFDKYRKLEQVHTILGFKSCDYLSDDYFTAKIMSIVLGGGMSSRLFQEVREKRGLAYGIYSYNMSYADSGEFRVCSSSTPQNVNELLKVTCGELLKITQNVTNKELTRAKKQVKSALLMAQENSDNRSQKLGSDMLAFGKYRDPVDVVAKIEKITVQDIEKLANKTFLSNKMTFSRLGDTKKVISLSDINNMIKK